jgi:hypothetical protein
MRSLKTLAVIGGGLLAAVAVACGSSSSGSTTPTPDAGDDSAAVSIGDDGSSATSCLPLSASGLCASGQTCCFDLMALSGSCVTAGSCSMPVQVQCLSAAQCGTQLCCADFGGGDGGLAALVEGGLGAFGLDAAALSSEAGVGGLTSSLSGVNLKVACETSCTGSQIQACASDQECAGGGSCVPLTSLLGDAGGAFGDAGVPSSFAMYATELGMDKACVPPSSGDAAAPVVDSGAPMDTGVPADAVAPTDAPADAVAE